MASLNEGDLFIFVNKKRSYLKILFVEGAGFCLFAKKLELGMFAEVDKTYLSLAEMTELVDRVVIGDVQRKRHLKKAA